MSQEHGEDHEDQQREGGINFTSIEGVFADISYPISTDEIIDQYGDHEIERTNAEPIAIEAVFGGLGETSFESEDELKTMLLGQMPRDSGGRQNYSDRGGSLPTETEAAEAAAEQTSADLEEGSATDRDSSAQ
jgi:hypothetical protein